MTPFSKSPPVPKTPQEFIEGATEHQELTVAKAKKIITQRPWEKFNKKATAKNTFNLRLNDYGYI